MPAVTGDEDMEHPVDMSDLSVEEKVGQLFMLAFEGSTPDDPRVLIRDYLVGGVYLSQDNLVGVSQAVRLLNALQEMAKDTPHALPILAACDHEGAWTVLNPYTASGPGNLALGATSPAVVEEMYAVMGRDLRAVGIAADLAPVADVNTNPRNPIIGARSFGEHPERVAGAVQAAVRGLHRSGILACAKHFPGHGDTAQDSHRGLATVAHPREQIVQSDLAPFRAAIRAGVDMVMTAHILYPAFDETWPATLSPTLLTGVLRQGLGFGGVIVTDSFNMGSMRRVYAPAEAAVRSINAGADLIMLAEERYGDEPGGYIAGQIALIKAVQTAVHDGRIPVERLDDAVRRVLALKETAGLFRREAVDPVAAERLVGNPDHRTVELEAARAAVVVVRNEDGRVPLTVEPKDLLIVVSAVQSQSRDLLRQTRGIGPNVAEPPPRVVQRELAQRHRHVDLLTITTPADISRDIDRLRAAATVLIVTENYPLPGFDFPTQVQHTVIEGLVSAGIAPIVLGLRDPYELQALPNVRTYITVLGYAPACARAVVDVLLGERPAMGSLPVSV
jgi:beta-N-acetylhexosaminidase